MFLGIMNSKNKQFIDDKMAEKVIDAVDFTLGKRITDILGRQCSKDVIRFNPVGNECGKVREQKGLSIKAVSAQMKIPQYRLSAIEKSDIKYIQPAVLESYIDLLGIREWFNGWMHENADVYGRLKKGNNRLHD